MTERTGCSFPFGFSLDKNNSILLPGTQLEYLVAFRQGGILHTVASRRKILQNNSKTGHRKKLFADEILRPYGRNFLPKVTETRQEKINFV
jgi:hypothetical protein